MDRCIVVARAAGAEGLRIALARLQALRDFYGPLGTPHLTGEVVSPARSVVGVIDMPGARVDLAGLCAFGALPAAPLDEPAAFMSATGVSLRTYDGPGLALCITESRVRLVSSCGPPAMLYRAAGDGMTAWSSHAIAAAFVATGTAAVDGAAIPELIAAQFVGGSRTTIRGAVALEPATAIDISEREATESSYWPADERRRCVPAAQAAEHAEAALLADLPRRVSSYAHPLCGLTRGLDSRVVAVAGREAGLDLSTFTFEGVDQNDVEGSPAIAESLGLAHESVATEWPEAEAQLSKARAEQRWSEGATHLALSQTAWPERMGAWVTGSGGETGRAFYYDRQTPIDLPNPNLTDLAGYITIGLQQRLAGAVPAAIESLRTTIRDWVDGAAAIAGVEGWPILDLVYAEQRLHRWLRGTAPRRAGVPIPALASVEVQRGLLSLPTGDKLTDGFHRYFLERHAPPELAAPEPPRIPSRRGLARRSRSRVAMAVPGLMRIRDRSQRREPSVTFLGPRRDPAILAWLAEEVLGSTLVSDALGTKWCERTRTRLLAGDDHAQVAALWAGGPVVAELELASLPLGL